MPSENKTPNYGLNQWQGNEYPKRQDFVDDNLVIDTEIKKAQDKADQAFQSASEGKQKIATAITGKGIQTSSSDTFQIMADNIEAIETDPSVGTTDATAADILLGKKAVSQGNLLTGTIPVAINVSPYEQSSELYLGGSGILYLKTQGNKYFQNATWLMFTEPNLISANVREGVTIGSTNKLTGTLKPASGNAVAADVRIGKTFSNASGAGTGNMPEKAAETITPGTANKTIAAGQYLSGVQTIAGSANLIASNIKDGVNLFGIVGTLKPVPASTAFVSRGFRVTTNIPGNRDWIEGTAQTGTSFSITSLLFLLRTTSPGTAYNINVTVPAGKSIYMRDETGATTQTVTGTITLTAEQYRSWVFYNPEKVAVTATSANTINMANFII